MGEAPDSKVLILSSKLILSCRDLNYSVADDFLYMYEKSVQQSTSRISSTRAAKVYLS